MLLATCKDKSGRAIPCRFTHCHEIASAIMKDEHDANAGSGSKKRATTPSDARGGDLRKKLRLPSLVPQVLGINKPSNDLGSILGSSSSKPIDLDDDGDYNMRMGSKENFKNVNGRLGSLKENQRPLNNRRSDTSYCQRKKKQHSKYLTGASIDEINEAISNSLPARHKKRFVISTDKAKHGSIDESYTKTASSDETTQRLIDNISKPSPEGLKDKAHDDAFYKLQKAMEAFAGVHHTSSEKVSEPFSQPDTKPMTDAQMLAESDTIIVDTSQLDDLFHNQRRQRKSQSQLTEAKQTSIGYPFVPVAPMFSTSKASTASEARMMTTPQHDASTPNSEKQSSAHHQAASTSYNGDKMNVAASGHTSHTAPSANSELPAAVNKVLHPPIYEDAKVTTSKTPKDLKRYRQRKDIEAKADIASVRSHIKLTVNLLNTSPNEDLKDELKCALSTAARQFDANMRDIIGQHGIGDNASVVIP